MKTSLILIRYSVEVTQLVLAPRVEISKYAGYLPGVMVAALCSRGRLV
jgi:hypothetical protein